MALKKFAPSCLRVSCGIALEKSVSPSWISCNNSTNTIYKGSFRTRECTLPRRHSREAEIASDVNEQTGSGRINTRATRATARENVTPTLTIAKRGEFIENFHRCFKNALRCLADPELTLRSRSI